MSGAASARYGTIKEREAAEMYEMDGWIVIRSAGSLGPADLLCMKAGEKPQLIQVKASKLPGRFRGFIPAQRSALRVMARKAGADAYLLRWYGGAAREWELVPEDEWPNDLPTRRLPDYIVDENGCWIWAKATQPDGYGIANRNGKSTLAHRVYYEATKGPIPDGLQIDHLCCIRACVNPDHLEAVTQDENRLRGRVTRLTARQVREIRASTERSGVLADRYGVTRGWIYHLRKSDRFRRDALAAPP